MYGHAVVLGPLVGYGGAKIVSYKNLACEFVVGLSQHWDFIRDNAGHSNCMKNGIDKSRIGIIIIIELV